MLLRDITSGLVRHQLPIKSVTCGERCYHLKQFSKGFYSPLSFYLFLEPSETHRTYVIAGSNRTAFFRNTEQWRNHRILQSSSRPCQDLANFSLFKERKLRPGRAEWLTKNESATKQQTQAWTPEASFPGHYLKCIFVRDSFWPWVDSHFLVGICERKLKQWSH